MRVNGTSLHVAEPVGDGELLVLVHGSWTDHTTWAAVVPLLASSFRVVAYDRRGHSRSPYGPGPSPRRRDEDDLIALIESLGGGGPAYLVGTSYGACISLAVAGRRPDLVRGLVAHEPPLLDLVADDGAEALLRSVIDQLAGGDVEGGTKRFFEDVALGPGGWELFPEPLRRAAMGNAQTFVDLGTIEDWKTIDVENVAAFPGPLVITLGDASPAWLPRIARGVAGMIGCPAPVIPEAGHAPHLTAPEPFAALIEEVLLGALQPGAPR
jgi:pimeloyl-ACP methyl ester carboxylesterase